MKPCDKNDAYACLKVFGDTENAKAQSKPKWDGLKIDKEATLQFLLEMP